MFRYHVGWLGRRLRTFLRVWCGVVLVVAGVRFGCAWSLTQAFGFGVGWFLRVVRGCLFALVRRKFSSRIGFGQIRSGLQM
jgi:hypothetical protein